MNTRAKELSMTNPLPPIVSPEWLQGELDAGTALTVDAARLNGTGAAFLGGAIAPGPALLADAGKREEERKEDQRAERGAPHSPAASLRPGRSGWGHITSTVPTRKVQPPSQIQLTRGLM